MGAVLICYGNDMSMRYVALLLLAFMTSTLARGDEVSDYKVLCVVWEKTEKPDASVTASERALLLREVDGHRDGIAPHDFRRMAAIALGNLRASEAVEKLIARLNDQKDEDMVSAEAARALGKIGDVRAMPHLLDALLDERTWVRIYACTALQAMKPTPEQLAAIAALQRYEKLLVCAEQMRLPTDERVWYQMDSLSNRSHDAAMQMNAMCAGLILCRPKDLPESLDKRTHSLAGKILAAAFPSEAYRWDQISDLSRFCREVEPKLFAAKTEKR